MNSKKIITIGILMSGLGAFSQNGLDSIPMKENSGKASVSLPSIDIYATVPRYGMGAGLGFGFFSQGFVLEQFGPQQKLEFRLGGDFYFLQYNQHKLGTMPLAAPQTGDAKVKLTQNNFGLNLVGRFVLVSGSARINPYLDIFAGLRGFSSDIYITPLKPQLGYESNTSTNLSMVNQWNYGATFGMMFSINEYIKINTGLMYTTSSQGGQIENIRDARIEGANIVTNKINTPRDFWVFKVGIILLVDKSKKESHCDCCCKRSQSSGSGIFIPSLGGGSLKSNSVNFKSRPSR